MFVLRFLITNFYLPTTKRSLNKDNTQSFLLIQSKKTQISKKGKIKREIHAGATRRGLKNLSTGIDRISLRIAIKKRIEGIIHTMGEHH